MAFRKSLLGKPVRVGSKLFSTRKVEDEEDKSTNGENNPSLTSEHPKRRDGEDEKDTLDKKKPGS